MRRRFDVNQLAVFFGALSVSAFMIWFILAEYKGLVAFGNYILAGIGDIPNAGWHVINYFFGLSSRVLYPSVLIGAVVGASSTTLYLLVQRGWVSSPLSQRTIVLSALASLIGYPFGVRYVVLIFGGLLSVCAIKRLSTIRQTATNMESLSFLFTGLALGAGIGGISSQIVLYPLNHCTYRSLEAYHYYHTTQSWIGYGITVASSFILLVPLWTVLTRNQIARRSTQSGYFRNRIMPYVLLAPTVLLMIVFLYYPASDLIGLSLHTQPDLLSDDAGDVCLENYIRLVDAQYKIAGRFKNTDYPAYANSFRVTMVITGATVILTMAAALGIAVLLTQKIRGIAIYRTLLVWPFALSPIANGAIFLAMFRDGQDGIVNWLLASTLAIQPEWLKDAHLAVWVVILASVWNTLGFNILIYMAALQNIPRNLLEAAAIDGANGLQRFRHVTFPLLSSFTSFLLVVNITFGFFNIYGLIDILTKGGPPRPDNMGGATDVLIYKVYNDTFGHAAGLGVAQSIILLLIVASIMVLQFGLSERRGHYLGK